MSRRRMIALLGMLAAAGCENMGLDYAGPAEEAQRRPPPELVAAVIPPSAPEDGQGLVVDGRLWVPAGSALALDEEDVRAVGSASGRTVYARAWDQSPYDRLFTRAGEMGSAEGATTEGATTEGARTEGAASAPPGASAGGAPGTGAAAPRGSMVAPEGRRWVAYLPVVGGGGPPRGSAGAGHGATGEAGGH